jgi:hypothetical protein
MKKPKERALTRFEKLLGEPKVILAILGLVFIIALPLRIQNIKLAGYISDDAWWHYRQIKEVVDKGRRLNPDIYEFTTLRRPMTYAPLFHYLVAYSYKPFAKLLPFIKFTHYFNVLEGLLYILLIFLISRIISGKSSWSLIGALSAAVSFGLIIRARAGELMAFVPSDLLALWGIFVFLKMAKAISNDQNFRLNLNYIFTAVICGLLLGLSLLSWSGAVFIYFPLFVFIFFALMLAKAQLTKPSWILLFICITVAILSCASWYLPLILKYGLNPHTKEMEWFMKGFTVLHQVKPLGFYIFSTGIAIFFVPLVFLQNLTKRDPLNLFFLFWIILAAIATWVGWRGYIAVVPIVACIAISVGLGRLVEYFFRNKPQYIPWVFSLLFIVIGAAGYRISATKLSPLNPKDVNEVRFNERSLKMLNFIRENYPDAITVDHISWVSEDEAIGKCRMINGQYLEYLPKGSSQAFIDVSKIYLSEEEEAFKICQKYNVGLIIARKHFLQLPQLSILFAPKELKSDDYLKIVKESPNSDKITVSFAPEGIKTLFFRMINRQNLQHFDLVYQDTEQSDNIPNLVVYKVKKTP